MVATDCGCNECRLCDAYADTQIFKSFTIDFKLSCSLATITGTPKVITYKTTGLPQVYSFPDMFTSNVPGCGPVVASAGMEYDASDIPTCNKYGEQVNRDPHYNERESGKTLSVLEPSMAWNRQTSELTITSKNHALDGSSTDILLDPMFASPNKTDCARV